MSSKKQSYALAVIVTIVAGVGMLSTAMSAWATTSEAPANTNNQPMYQTANDNENDNENSNSNYNNIVMGQSPHLAQIPSYQYPPAYQPPVPPPPAYPPAPSYVPPAPYYEAPGIPNAGFGDIPLLNLAILFASALFFLAGIAYLFPWSKHDVTYS